jgi:hypothetical protein
MQTLITIAAVFLVSVNAVEGVETQEEVAKWVTTLGDDDFQKRNGARDRLLQAGIVANGELAKALNSKDIEVRTTAEELLQSIMLRKAIELAEKSEGIEGDFMLTLFSDKFTGHFKSANSKLLVIESGSRREIRDGEFYWVQSISKGEHRVIKHNLDEELSARSGNHLIAHELILYVKPLFNFVSVKEEEFDGHAVLVFGGVVKPPANSMEEVDSRIIPKRKCLVSLDKTLGITRRIQIFDDEGKLTMQMELANLKFGQKFAPAIFSYKPPQDCKVYTNEEWSRKFREEYEAKKRQANPKQ